MNVTKGAINYEMISFNCYGADRVSMFLPDVANQFNKLVTKKISCQLRHMTQDWTHPKEGCGSIQIFQMPVEKCEHEAVSKTHKPRHEQHRAVLHTAQQSD